MLLIHACATNIEPISQYPSHILGNSAILPSFFLCYSIQPARSQKIAHSSSFDILSQWLTIPYVATLQHAAQYRPSRNGGQFFLPGYWLHYSQIQKQLLFFPVIKCDSPSSLHNSPQSHLLDSIHSATPIGNRGQSAKSVTSEVPLDQFY